MKLQTVLFLIFYNSVLFAVEISEIGRAPYFDNNVTLSKQLAVEDALLKISLRYGGQISSDWISKNDIGIIGRVRFSNNLLFKKIYLKYCRKKNNVLLCKLQVDKISTHREVQKSFSTIQGNCRDVLDKVKQKIVECYEIDKSHIDIEGKIVKITAILGIYVYRYGIDKPLLRYSEFRLVMGVGHSVEQSKNSLKAQVNLKFSYWKKSNLREELLLHESFLHRYIVKRSDAKKKYLISQGIIPYEIFKFDNMVLIFGKKLNE